MMPCGGASRAGAGRGTFAAVKPIVQSCLPRGRGPWNPASAAERAYPVTEFQPHYFVAASLHDARARMRTFCQNLARSFYAHYHPATEGVWVDRAVRRM